MDCKDGGAGPVPSPSTCVWHVWMVTFQYLFLIMIMIYQLLYIISDSYLYESVVIMMRIRIDEELGEDEKRDGEEDEDQDDECWAKLHFSTMFP